MPKNPLQAATPAEKAPSPLHSKKWRIFFTSVLLVFIMFTLIVIIKNQQGQQNTAQTFQVVQDTLTALKEKQQRTQTQLEQALHDTAEQTKSWQNQVQAIQQQLQHALQEQLYQPNDWMLQKIRYYLELAQINALWSDDPQTVLSLMQTADTLLAKLHDQHALPIRQALAKNITALKNLNPVDIAGLLCQLDAIQENSDRLSFKPINAHKTSIASITAGAAPKDWQDKLKNNLAFLENLVSIHHYDGAVLPVPTPLLESLLREELRLSIKEAQWALLQNNQSVYQRSLINAIKTSKRAFADTHQIIPPLEALQKIHLTKNKFFSDEALMLLNQWIESRMQAPLETKSNKVEPLP